MVTRPLSMWPFAARLARLFLLVDPSLADQSLRNGLLRAMQQGYFGSDGYSQTRAVREAALAAHYVLRHHNRDVLPIEQINAASALAAVRGDVAFVALAGHAAAFAWHAGELTGQRGILRLPRPLGLEQDPIITLWRTPLRAGDRLALVCGGTWRPDSQLTIARILSEATSTAAAEDELAAALGDTRPAGILVVAPASPSPRIPHLRLLTNRDHADTLTHDAPAPLSQIGRQRFSPGRWIVPLLGLVLLAMIALATLAIMPQPGALANHVEGVSPQMAVRLGPSAANVVDVAAGDSAVYTLDVAQGAVRSFSLDQLDQQATPDTLLAKEGTSLDGMGRQLALPVAIEYVPGPKNQSGTLAIVDQARTVVQVGADRALSAHELPTSAGWQQLGALGSGTGELVFLDSDAGRILTYPAPNNGVVDAPRVVVDAVSAPYLPWQRVAQIVTTGESLILRFDDGSVHRLAADGIDQPLTVQSTDGRPVETSALATDRAGGLYLADPDNARIVQTDLRGNLQREMRAAEFASVRAMDVSLDGQRLYALIDSGILVVDIPAE
ncbi:MAG: hypothetical protein JO057_03585 [Chloroflexi bacterium]|nr:hypothetical protein [Chloroflexota bacterium]